MQATGAIIPAEQDYFNYAGGMVDLSAKHLAQTLCISETGDSAVLLLNPMVIWPDGEWEKARLFANWLPGASRYRSFADWIRHERAGLTDETFAHSVVPGELPIVYLDGPGKPSRRVRPREEILTFDEALKRLSSKTRSRRIKAVRHLARIGGDRAIQTLAVFLKVDYDYHVRCEAAEMLGGMRAKEAIAPLIEVTAETSYVASTAVQALGNFNDESSARRLLNLIEEDGSSSRSCGQCFGENDPRGVPVLVQRVISKEARDQHTGNIAGRYIAQFERAGYQALEPLTSHEEVEIRRRAINGIFDLACLAKEKALKMEARGLLETRLKTESDEALRLNLQVYIAIACNKKLPDSENPFSGA